MALPFSIEDLERAVENGDVTKRPHPTLPYHIYNYSPETQYAKKWNDVTLNCRGLILDNNYNIIARPWKKFFNLGEVNLPIQFTDPVEVMDKADGSLGILYPIFHYDGEGDFADVTWAVSTRGSMVSEQAIHATKLWEKKYSHLMPMFGYTMLFEIVYPENRIVLNYDGMDDLILLGAVENETGYYMSPRTAKGLFVHRETKQYAEYPGPVVETYNYNSISDAISNMGRRNKEGFVIRSHNFMVKLKEPDYLELHRLVTNMTPKTIWEQLKGGKTVTEIVADLPDEFHSMAEDIALPLVERFNERLDEIVTLFLNVRNNVQMYAANRNLDMVPTRKQYAESFKQYKDGKYFFSLLDGRDIKEALWNELKPRESDVRSDAD